MTAFHRLTATLALCFAFGAPLAAQTGLSLGNLTVDRSQPVEIAAENFSVDRASGQAVFSGEVRIGQGELRLAADKVEVFYSEESGEIARLKATGGVTFVTPTEQAEAAEADYDLTSGLLTLTGEVLLTQGGSALSAQKMVVNLADGTAEMQGGVRSVLAPQAGQ